MYYMYLLCDQTGVQTHNPSIAVHKFRLNMNEKIMFFHLFYNILRFTLKILLRLALILPLLSCFLCLLHIQVHFRLNFFMEACKINPDQTAPKGQYCLQYRLPKNISRLAG